MKKKISFIEVAELVIADCEVAVAAGLRPLSILKDYRHRIGKYYGPYFGDMAVDKVTFRTLKDFQRWLVEELGHSPATVLIHMSFVSVTLKLAADEGHLTSVPRVPRPKQKDSPRPAFSQPEYRHLLKTLRIIERERPPAKVRSWVITEELRDFVAFMVNSFLRPGDAFSLRHKDIERKLSHTGSPYLKIISSRSKTHLHPVVTMPTAVSVYERLRTRHSRRGLGGQEHYVFLPEKDNRQVAQQIIRRQFNYVLERADLRKNALGELRTIYSLRHTAIMFRLLLGDIDLLTLARNCRTSVEMIDRFYAKSLTAEMNLDRLHNTRKPSRRVHDTIA